MRLRTSVVALVGCACILSASAAFADPIIAGTYQLHNHPDGAVAPPGYGLRLDELDNATSGHDIFTFDFDKAGAAMFLTYDDSAQTVHIFGQAWGGRDVGGSYANDSYLGIYAIDFLYDVNVADVPGDDDIWVTAPPDQQNTGSVTGPGGMPVYALSDISNGQYTFRFGDEDDDNGHRGFDGISGWGWVAVDGEHDDSQDWLFTAVLVPEPASISVLLVGLAAVCRRRR